MSGVLRRITPYFLFIPLCSTIFCGRPQVSYQSHVKLQPDQRTYRYNDVVRFSCSVGFTLTGDSEKRCQQSGDFQRNVPTCTAIICGRPPVSYQSHVTLQPDQQTYRYNDVVRFSCSDGYMLTGDSEKRCQQSGDFQRNVPTCRAIICGRPPVSYQSHVTLQPYQPIYRYNEVGRFSCSDGFTLTGDSEKRCQQSGDFQRNVPTCTAIICGRPPVSYQSHVTLQPDQRTYRYNDVVRFSCSEGFTLSGDSEKRCQQNGDFQRNVPICRAIICDRPPVSYQSHVTLQPDQQTYRYNDVVRFSCSVGFTLTGDSERRCQESGDFQRNLPTCTVITCQRPELSIELHIAANPFKQTFYYNESDTFYGSAGFSLQGPLVKYYRQKGDFQTNILTCANVTCQRPSLSNARQLLGTDPLQETFSYNESVVFSCSNGFKLQGPSIIYCRQNSDFKYNIPICTAESSERSFTVAFISGGVAGMVVITSVAIVVFILRRRVRRKKKNGNETDERSQVTDNKDGINYQSNESEGHYSEICPGTDDNIWS